LSIQIRCFHGTTLDRAISIKGSGFFDSTSDGLWLGTGIYFFENGYEHASSWAKRLGEDHGVVPAIIEAKLNIQVLVDLSDRAHWQAMKDARDCLFSNGVLPEQAGPEVLLADDEVYRSQSWKHECDHVVVDQYLESINYEMAETGRTVDAVRCPFVGGRQVYEDSWFFRRSCSMIAIKNGEAIADLEIHHLS